MRIQNIQGNAFFQRAQRAGAQTGAEKALSKAPLKRKDSGVFSSKSPISEMIDKLNEQKKSVTQQKYKTLAAGVKNDMDPKVLDAQLSAYDEQLKNLDEQISQLQATQAEQQSLQSEDKKAEDKTQQPKTLEELQQERVTKLTHMAASFEQNDVIAEVQGKLEAQARTLKQEAKLDSAHAVRGQWPDIYVSEAAMKLADGKDALADEMKRKADALSVKCGENAAEMQKELMEDVEEVIEAEKTGETEKSSGALPDPDQLAQAKAEEENAADETDSTQEIEKDSP